MKATSVLASHPVVNDTAFAAECDVAFARAQVAIDTLQWVPSTSSSSDNASAGADAGGYYAAASSGCTANASTYTSTNNSSTTSTLSGGKCTEQVGVFADAFYAQVLAYSVGLGDLLAQPARLRSHLQYVSVSNCVRNEAGTNELVKGECPNGLVIFTGRAPQLTDLQVPTSVYHSYDSHDRCLCL